MLKTTKLLLFVLYFVPSESYYNRILDKADNALYVFPKNAETIADVDWCREEEPCGVVSRRFWLPRMVLRECRCKNLPCNTQYSMDPISRNTVQLDNRSQFKMCDSGEEEADMAKCKYGGSEIGVSVEETRSAPTEGADDGPSREGGHLTERKVYVHCRCVSGYWQLSRHTLDRVNSSSQVIRNHYHCNKLGRCKKGDFCGHVRGDTHSSYYRCTCPLGTLCISTDKTLRNASELLYDGPMYRAYCQPVPQDE